MVSALPGEVSSLGVTTRKEYGMRKVARGLLLVIAISGLAAGASAQRNRRDAGSANSTSRDAGSANEWTELGTRTVDGPCDHDSIQVGHGHDNPMSTIRLSVEQSDLELYDIVVTFADGSTFSPNTRLVFHEGERSRQIDLPGNGRVIRRVDFRYGNRAGGGRAQLTIAGR
jgi:hypothetical protein